MSIEEVVNAALALPPEAKARLAEDLLASLDNAHRKEIDAAWAEEAEDRIDAFNRGELKAIPGDQVLRELRER